MRRWETLAALAAVILASAAALPTRSRLFYALAAIAILVVVGLSRLRGALSGRRATAGGFDAATRAEQIRNARSRKMRR